MEQSASSSLGIDQQAINLAARERWQPCASAAGGGFITWQPDCYPTNAPSATAPSATAPSATATRTGVPSATATNTGVPSVTATNPPGPTATQSGDNQPGFPIRAVFYYPWFPEAWNQQGFNPFTNYTPSLGFLRFQLGVGHPGAYQRHDVRQYQSRHPLLVGAGIEFRPACGNHPGGYPWLIEPQLPLVAFTTKMSPKETRRLHRSRMTCNISRAIMEPIPAS